MKCPKCRTQNPESAKFCNECSHFLLSPAKGLSTILSMDEKLERIQRYLPTGLMEKILAQTEKIEGERKQVTVMFCDMEAFTPLVELLGPEEAYNIMDEIYEILIRKVYDFEGTVNEMTGDGIMALFGAPVAFEDAPQRALWAAQAIHQEIAKFNDEKDKRVRPIKMRIGINSGPVVVGSLGNDLKVEFKAVGDTVNLAFRMEGLARPGTTLVSEETFRQTRNLFQFKGIGKKSVKGKRKAVPVYKLISSEKDVYRPRLGSERRIYTEMVGRDYQLDILGSQVMQVIHGKGAIVNIIGEAGIGKSRLVAELKKREVMKEVTHFEGRAISIGRNLSFHPIIDILKQWARIGHADTETESFYKLETVIRSICSEDVYEVLPFVATLMKLSLPDQYAQRIKGIEGEALEKLILKNVRELLIKAAEFTPLVFIIDDLHWVDRSSIELLESLFQLVETHRILFVNLFRPAYPETGGRIKKNVRETLPGYYIEFMLDPLNEPMSKSLVSTMLNLGVVHNALIEKIIQRAGGNPFFIEEIVQSLIDEGTVILRNGAFQVTEKSDAITIPLSINDVLMARIDRLEEKTRDLVKVAAVIGRYFFYRVLIDVADFVEDIDSRLSHLKELQLVQERRRLEEVEYSFKHVLAQEAAYESILLQRRKALHFKVARSIEKLFYHKLEDFFGMLAYHYSRAEHLEEAEKYLIRAGERALKSSASNEALYYYQEALDLFLKRYGYAADPEKMAMLEKNIALALYSRGQYVEAVKYFERALNYYWKRLPKHGLSTIIQFISGISTFIIYLYFPYFKSKRIPTQRDNEIVDLFQKKCKALAVINPKRFLIETVYAFKKITKYDLAKLELGAETFAGASALFSFSGLSFRLSRKILDFVQIKFSKTNVRILIRYEWLETLHNYLQGNWKKIKTYDKELINKSLDLGEIYEVSQYLYWHGFPKIYQGSHNIAEAIVSNLKEIYEIYRNHIAISFKYELNTNLLIEYRKLHDALCEVEEGIDFVQKAVPGYVLIEMYSWQALIHILMRDVEKAENSLRHANRFRLEVEAPVPMQLSSFYRSRLEYELYRLNEAMKNKMRTTTFEYRKKAGKSCKKLLKLARKSSQYRVDAFRLAGNYFWLINKEKKAFQLWQKGLEEGERLGARLQLSRIYLELGIHLQKAESGYAMFNRENPIAYLERARALFIEMNLEWDLEKLNRLADHEQRSSKDDLQETAVPQEIGI